MDLPSEATHLARARTTLAHTTTLAHSCLTAIRMRVRRRLEQRLSSKTLVRVQTSLLPLPVKETRPLTAFAIPEPAARPPRAQRHVTHHNAAVDYATRKKGKSSDLAELGSRRRKGRSRELGEDILAPIDLQAAWVVAGRPHASSQ